MRAPGAGSGDAPAYVIFDGITFDGTNAKHDVVKIGAWDATIDPPDGPAHHITWGSDGVELIGMEIDHIGRNGSPNSQCIYGVNSYSGFDVKNHVIKNSTFHDCIGGGINVGEGSGHLVSIPCGHRQQRVVLERNQLFGPRQRHAEGEQQRPQGTAYDIGAYEWSEGGPGGAAGSIGSGGSAGTTASGGSSGSHSGVASGGVGTGASSGSVDGLERVGSLDTRVRRASAKLSSHR